MGAPPAAEFVHHGGSDRHVAVLAAFAVADVQARRVVAAVDVTQADGNGLAHAQATVIHQAQAGAEASFGDCAKQRLHFDAGKDDRQDLRLGNAQFVEDGRDFFCRSLDDLPSGCE